MVIGPLGPFPVKSERLLERSWCAELFPAIYSTLAFFPARGRVPRGVHPARFDGSSSNDWVGWFESSALVQGRRPSLCWWATLTQAPSLSAADFDHHADGFGLCLLFVVEPEQLTLTNCVCVCAVRVCMSPVPPPPHVWWFSGFETRMCCE